MPSSITNCIFLIILVALFSACNKENPAPAEPQLIDAALKNYIFKENSYWIYSNEDTLLEDSIYVQSIEKKNYKYTSGSKNYNFECYKIIYKNQIGETYTDHIFSNQIRRNADESNPAETGKLIFYHFTIEGYEGERFENLQEIETIKYHTDGYGNRWTNAIRLYSINSTVPDDGDYIIYTDEAGIIYYTENFIDISNRKIKSLIRWQVEKI